MHKVHKVMCTKGGSFGFTGEPQCLLVGFGGRDAVDGVRLELLLLLLLLLLLHRWLVCLHAGRLAELVATVALVVPLLFVKVSIEIGVVFVFVLIGLGLGLGLGLGPA